NWEPWQVTPTPEPAPQTAAVDPGQWLAEDSVSTPPGRVVASAGEPVPAEPSLTERVIDAGRGAVEYAGNAARMASDTLNEWGLGPAGGADQQTSRIVEIQQRAARDQGKNLVDARAADDPEWRAANPDL